jgi:hypothetical protein
VGSTDGMNFIFFLCKSVVCLFAFLFLTNEFIAGRSETRNKGDGKVLNVNTT